jgi:flagellar assembly factor FliW
MTAAVVRGAHALGARPVNRGVNDALTQQLAPASPESENLPVIEFVAPMPGFPGDRRFVLVSVHDAGLLYSLTCLDTVGLRFLVAPPAPFFPEYAPEVDDETLRLLGNNDPADLLLLLVVSTQGAAASATVNLMAPIVIDQGTRRAVQLVLAGADLSVRQPLLLAGGSSCA